MRDGDKSECDPCVGELLRCWGRAEPRGAWDGGWPNMGTVRVKEAGREVRRQLTTSAQALLGRRNLRMGPEQES
jgi:hypothetical protein